MPKPILCLDFDGVIHSYSSGWQGTQTVTDLPVSGVFDWILKAQAHWEIHVYSSRSSQPGGIEAMKRWFRLQLQAWLWQSPAVMFRESVEECVSIYMTWLHWPLAKPSAFLTIDDRAICFDGSWEALDPQLLLQFRPWTKRDEWEAKERA